MVLHAQILRDLLGDLDLERMALSIVESDAIDLLLAMFTLGQGQTCRAVLSAGKNHYCPKGFVLVGVVHVRHHTKPALP